LSYVVLVVERGLFDRLANVGEGGEMYAGFNIMLKNNLLDEFRISDAAFIERSIFK
jgi:hypothetical protein